MLAKIIAENRFAPKAVVGFLAGRRGRRRHPYVRRRKPRRRARHFVHLAPATDQATSKPNVALAISSPPSPAASRTMSAAFVVTAGFEEIAIADRFERANDDYSSILVQGARRPVRRGFRPNACTRGCAGFLGLCSGRGARPERTRRRALSRHPAPRPAIAAQPATRRS